MPACRRPHAGRRGRLPQPPATDDTRPGITMGRRLSAVAWAACLLLACGSAAAAEPVLAQRDGVLGTSFEMQVAGAAGQAPLAIDAALGEIARLEASLSTWHDDSTLSAYNAVHLATEALPHDVAAVLALCARWRVRTPAAFSCRLGKIGRAHVCTPVTHAPLVLH